MSHPRHETARSAGKGGPLRRAWIAAWMVFLSMAGTTMAYQVYHSIRFGHMPVALAVLYGVVPLLISVCVLEIVAEWEQAPGWAKAAAYLITAGAMYLSAASTGAVVLHAAPPRMSLLFGFLLDGAAILAIHFILNGPRKADERAAAEAERRAAAERAEAGEIARVRAALTAERELHDAEVRALRGEAEVAGSARTEAERRAELAEAKARKLEAHATPKATRNPRSAKDRNAPKATVPNDVDARVEAMRILAETPDISGAKLGELCGKSERWGQLRKSELATHVADGGSQPGSAEGSTG